MPKPPNADYCLEIRFEKGSRDPGRVFRAMQELIDAFQELDRSLVKSIDSNIEPILILEDIEAGSIRSWLSNVLEAVDDDAIKNLDWKPAVGKYLVKAKYIAVDFLKGRTHISNATEVRQLEDRLQRAAQETDVKWLPIYDKISSKQLLHGYERISNSLSYLQPEDKVSYIVSEEEQAPFNMEFRLAPESIEDLITKERICQQSEMILKVKKPDYLGESKWDFRHGGRSFPAKVVHKEWLQSFQNREINIRPGDSIRARVELTDRYDYEGELIATDFNILEILEVIQMDGPKPKQIEMFDGEE